MVTHAAGRVKVIVMTRRTFLGLMLLALLWGPAFLFVKLAVREIPPLTLVATRVSLAALLLLLIVRLQGRAVPATRAIWKHFAVMGLFSNALPFGLLTWGQQHIPSSLAAILVGATPLFTILLAHVLISDEGLSRAKAIGVLLGFGGVVLLFAPALRTGVSATMWGLAAATVAAASYGVATVYGRLHLRGLPPLVGPMAQLTSSAVVLVPLSLVVEQPWRGSMPSPAALGMLLLLTIFSTALAYVVYYRLMETTSATNMSLVTYLIPLVATLLGVVVLRERVGWNVYLACLLIFGGIMTAGRALRMPILRRSLRPLVRSVVVRSESHAVRQDC